MSREKLKWNSNVPAILGGLMWMVALAHPLVAQTVQQGPDGFIVQLTNGESVNDAWLAIKAERESTNAPTGLRDLIELGPGVFPLTGQNWDSLQHFQVSTGNPIPPLVISGTSAAASSVRCRTPSSEKVCAASNIGLVFENLSILTSNSAREPVMRVTDADLTFSHVRMVAQSIALEPGYGAINVSRGNLTIEDSVLDGNQLDQGLGVVVFDVADFAGQATISRSTLSGNRANAVVRISSSGSGGLTVEQSTLVANEWGVVFQGTSGENVSVSRSILNGTISYSSVQLTITDSFTGSDPQLIHDEHTGNRIPRPLSPVIDGLPCPSPGFDQRGLPTGVQASYLEANGTDCDYGSIEAQDPFCIATDHGTVACGDGEIEVAEAIALGCRVIGGLLDCTGGGQAEVTFLDRGESLLIGNAELFMQADGNLVLYDDGVAQWATGTEQGPCIGYYAEVQPDGDLVVFSDPQAPVGALVCYSSGKPVEQVVLRQGFRGAPAQLVGVRADGSVEWITNHGSVPPGESFILHGTRFLPDNSLTIPGAQALMQLDGNFVLYDTIDGVETAIWATGTETVCAGQDAIFQGDGNLVVGAAGTACFGGSFPPPGGTVLRLHRTPFGTAALSLYNPQGEVLWSVPESTTEADCGDFPAGSPDGVYTVVDRIGVQRQVYCDMSGGGWMLVGKVYRSHAGGSGLPEPFDWWTAGTGQEDALLPGTVDWTEGSNMVSYGSAWLADLNLDVARFDLIAEFADPFTRIGQATPGETASWYKDASTVATWFSTADIVPTSVCSDETLSCMDTGRIVATQDATFLEGMKLPAGNGWIHTRVDNDSRPAFDGMCSYTFGNPSWLDSAADHWGNGLDIWVK